MTTPDNRVLTTHAGSLIRPPRLRSFLRKQRDGEPYDEAEFQRCLRESVARVVGEQADAGVDIVSDGEFGKPLSWSAYVRERIAGLEHRPEEARPGGMPPTTDRRMFPEFWAEYGGSQGLDTGAITGWVVTGPLVYSGQDAMRRDIDNFTAALENVDVTAGFLPVVAPASGAAGIRWDDVYDSEEAFLYAFADALREEYRMILDAGLVLQVDDAYLPWMFDITVPPGTLESYREWARLRVDVLNHALRGLPTERIRYHICWGSFNAPHVGDVPARDIIDLVLAVDAGAYVIEMANPRHEHEWRLWRDVELPEGKVLVPGVISHATNVVEHPELVAERLVRLAELVGRERVVGGTDCGFAQGPFVQRVHPSIMWAKLRALADGAGLATKTLADQAVAKPGR